MTDELPTTPPKGVSNDPLPSSFQPRNEAELAETLRGCGAQRRRVRLSGGGVVAKPPSSGALGVWLSGISGIVEIRAEDLVATVYAGTSLREIDHELRKVGRRFPLRPHDAHGRASVGGTFAAGADGLRARMGFRARDLLLGARAVLGTGERVFVGAKVVKSVSGFDVTKALVGSRGTLAAMTELTFRVEAVPEAKATLAGVFASRAEAHAAIAAADALPLVPSGLAVSQGDGQSYRVDVLIEGPRAAVAAANTHLGNLGLRQDAGQWARLTTFAALEPKGSHGRFVGSASRAAPLDSVPPGAVSFVVDVLRGRVVAHLPSKPEATPRETDPLLENVRRAFDPDGVFDTGRGLGVS